MVHEINFLSAAGSDFLGTNKTDIPRGMDVQSKSAFENAETKRQRRRSDDN